MDTGFVMQYATVGRLSAANGKLETAVSVLDKIASRGFGERARLAQASDFQEGARDPGCRQLIQMVCPAPRQGRDRKIPVPLRRRSTRANLQVPFTTKTSSAGISGAFE